MTEVARAVTSADRTLGHASGAKPKRGARPRAAAAPGPLLGPVSPGSVLAAQRLAGNRAVGAVLASSGSVVQRDDWGIELPDIEIPSLGDVLRQVPYYEEITTVLGFDPVTGEAVEPAPSRLIRELFAFVGAEHVYDQIAEFEVVQPVVELIDSELDAADLTSARLSRMVDQAWDEVDLTPRIGMIDDAVALVERHLTVLIADVEGFATSLLNRVIEIVKDAAIGQAEALLSESESAAKAWELAKLVMGHDPLRDQPVSTSTEQIIEAFLLLIGREQELEMMRAQGTMAATVDWINGHLATFDSILGDFEALVDGVLSALTVEELPNLAANVTSLSQQGLALINRVANFATTVAAEVLQLIEDSLLEMADEHAQEVPGFHLVTALAGRNPITDKPVDQGPEQIIKGFITLIPGGQEQYEQMAETGVINDAANRIQGAIDELGITWEFVSNLFSDLWDSFTIEDLLVPVEAIERVVNRFGEPIGRLVAFVRVVVEEVFKLVVDLTGFPSDLIENIVANAMSAFDRIQEDPAQFFINMLEALKLGFSNFFDNIGEYLLSGLASWLFRGLERAGITIPDEITLESILGVVFQVLGLSEDRLWAKLGERLGSETVEAIRAGMDRLSGIWNFISDVTENGIAAVWRYIESQVSNLWDTILEKAQEWVLTEIIEAVIVKLVSMLDPTGIMAVVRSLQAVYNAIESAVEYMRDMLVIIDRYVATIAEIAQGSLESGATQLEEGLAASLPVAIGFLANQAGFGDVAEEIQRIIQGIQEVVDQALDWLLDRAIEAGGAILGALGVGDAEQADEETGGRLSPAAVKAKAREMLSGRAFKDGAEARSALDTVWSKLQPVGLKGLRLDPGTKSRPPAVLASASVAERINLSTSAAEVLSIALRMRMFTGTTSAFITYGGNVRFGPALGYTNRGGHAEIHIERHAPRLLRCIERDRSAGMFGPNERVPIVIDMNRLPCDHCVDRMKNAFDAAVDSGRVSVTINAASVWQSTTGAIELTSDESLRRLMERGIQVQPLHVWPLIQRRLRELRQREVQVGGRVYAVEEWLNLNAGSNGVGAYDVEEKLARLNAAPSALPPVSIGAGV